MRQLHRIALIVRAEWDQPDQFDWITNFLTERGLLGSARLVLATVAATAGMVPFAVLLSQRRPTLPLLVAQVTGIALTTVMAIYLFKRWPNRRQSQAAAVLGLMCITVWCQAQPNAAMSAQICMAAAITGGYVGFLHSNKMLVGNFAVALTINVLTTLRLVDEIDLADAVGSFWLVFFMNLSVPLAIRSASRAIWVYATRSTEDPLTGLLNRRAFTDALITRLGGRSTGHLIVMLVDIDDFKRVNDTYGHVAGDRTLVAVAEVLRDHVDGDATVCRSGGEEFLVAYTRATADPAHLPAQLCAGIAALSPSVTASIGVTSVALDSASLPASVDFIDHLIDVADQAMYAVKRDGGNGYATTLIGSPR